MSDEQLDEITHVAGWPKGPQALREAADDIETALLDEMVPETVRQADVVTYLRRRADRMEARHA